MFTGIVEEIGTVSAVRQGANSLTLSIRCSKVLSDVQKGDSIAVDGVCLTVAEHSNGHFSADVMPETVKATTIQSLQTGSAVNLERAMAANGRFGGHIVSGHVDATGQIIARKRESNAIYIEIMLLPDLLKYLIPKGSIAVDGTSLTVFGVTDNSFMISLIPVTQEDSVIGHKQIGDRVNIECDMLAKYMERLMGMDKRNVNSGISMESLAASGFLD